MLHTGGRDWSLGDSWGGKSFYCKSFANCFVFERPLFSTTRRVNLHDVTDFNYGLNGVVDSESHRLDHISPTAPRRPRTYHRRLRRQSPPSYRRSHPLESGVHQPAPANSLS